MTNSHLDMTARKRGTPEMRKSQIMAAADLVLLEVGMDRFTVDQVIEKAGIAKGTIYNYYKNKDEMLMELGIKALDLLHQHFKTAIHKQDNSIDKVKAICISNYHYQRKYPEYYELIIMMERPDFNINMRSYFSISQDIQRLTASVITEGQKKGEIKADLDTAMINYIIWACCVGVTQFVETKKKLLKNYHEINREEMIETFADMITEGMIA